MRFITPIILIGISVVVFLVLTNPMYGGIAELKAERDSYNEALDNSKALENARDALTTKKNSMKPDNLEKLQRLLPENIDNIRLILEIEKIALPYGMVLKDVKYNTNKDAEKGASNAAGSPVGGAQAVNKDYGVWDLEFSTSGPYNNFLNFTRDLESNLRIVDITSIQFSSTTPGGAINTGIDSYKYNFKIRTYWLKN
jgi:Tfp pilus assembly protein PilO